MILHRFAEVTAVMAFLLIIAGGLVTSTGSGLSVPDWPLSFGSLTPPMVGGVVYEHSHRVVASLVGLMVTILAVWIWRTDTRRGVKMLGLGAFVAIVVQGVLGGLTVLFKLPVPISVAHATLGQAVFSSTVILALMTSPGYRKPVRPVVPAMSATREFAVVISGAVLLQLVLGAWMRHTGAGLAIPDFPLSYGMLVPPLGEAEIAALNSLREHAGLSPVTGAQVAIHFAHRVVALCILVISIFLTNHTVRKYRDERRFREPVLVLQVLVLFQVFLGALAIWTGKGVEVATGHVAIGALILATSTVFALQVFRTPTAGLASGRP